MKRTITWIRHGQSEWNALGKWQGHTDTLLSDLGKTQAGALAARLKNRPFDIVFSSDLLRASETGRLALPDADLQLDPRLREIHFGIYEGKTSDGLSEQERRSVYGWWADPYSRKLEGGESMECLNDRVQSWMNELPTECNVAVFTHGGVIRNAVWQIAGKPHDGEWSVVVDNTSLTIVEYSDRRNLLCTVNDSAHLES
jgi:broad specificity phosphatase PhoE